MERPPFGLSQEYTIEEGREYPIQPPIERAQILHVYMYAYDVADAKVQRLPRSRLCGLLGLYFVVGRTLV